MPEDVLAYCGLDLGIVGDGEESLPLLVRKLAAGDDCRSVPGLVYRDGIRVLAQGSGVAQSGQWRGAN